jgi:hypothetical protein
MAGFDCPPRQRAEDVDDDLDVDLAHTLQRSPMEGVLIQQFAGLGRLHVPAAEVDAVTLEQLNLLLGQDDGVVLSLPLQSQQPLVTGLQIMPNPNPANPARSNLDALKTELVGDTLTAVSRTDHRVVEDLLLDLRGYTIRMRTSRSALVFQEPWRPPT